MLSSARALIVSGESGSRQQPCLFPHRQTRRVRGGGKGGEKRRRDKKLPNGDARSRVRRMRSPAHGHESQEPRCQHSFSVEKKRKKDDTSRASTLPSRKRKEKERGHTPPLSSSNWCMLCNSAKRSPKVAKKRKRRDGARRCLL